jgi:hypothetical protein
MLVNARDYVLVDRHRNVCTGIGQIPVSAWQVFMASSHPALQHVLKYTDTPPRIARLKNLSPSKTASACDNRTLGKIIHTGNQTN